MGIKQNLVKKRDQKSLNQINQGEKKKYSENGRKTKYDHYSYNDYKIQIPTTSFCLKK